MLGSLVPSYGIPHAMVAHRRFWWAMLNNARFRLGFLVVFRLFHYELGNCEDDPITLGLQLALGRYDVQPHADTRTETVSISTSSSL